MAAGPDGCITHWNSAAELLFGYTAQEMIGRPIALLLPDERVREHALVARRVAKGEHLPAWDTVRLRKGGVPVDVSMGIWPLRDAGGAVLGELVVVRAVSALHGKALDPLRDPDLQRLAAIVECSDDAIIGKSLSGVVTSWNRGAERIFGYSAQEMLGQTLAPIYPPERLREQSLMLARIERGERVEHFETVRRHKYGDTLHVSVTISPIRDQTGRVVGASKVARDISERIRTERRLWMHDNWDLPTQLPNRKHFQDRMTLEFARARRTRMKVALVLIEFDGLDDAQDLFGSGAETALAQAAQRIRAALREVDLVGRMGGRTLGVMLPDLAPAGEAEHVVRRLRQEAEPPGLASRVAGEHRTRFGLAVYTGDDAQVEEVILRAGDALRAARPAGPSAASGSAVHDAPA